MKLTALGDDRTQLIDSLTDEYVEKIGSFSDPCNAVKFLFDKMILSYKMLPLIRSIESGKVSMKKPATFSPDEQKNTGALVERITRMANAIAARFPQKNFDECPYYPRYTHYLDKFNDAIEIINTWSPIDPEIIRDMEASRSAAIAAGDLDFPLISDQAKAFYINQSYMGDLKEKPLGALIRKNYRPSGDVRTGEAITEEEKNKARKEIYEKLDMETPERYSLETRTDKQKYPDNTDFSEDVKDQDKTVRNLALAALAGVVAYNVLG